MRVARILAIATAIAALGATSVSAQQRYDTHVHYGCQFYFGRVFKFRVDSRLSTTTVEVFRPQITETLPSYSVDTFEGTPFTGMGNWPAGAQIATLLQERDGWFPYGSDQYTFPIAEWAWENETKREEVLTFSTATRNIQLVFDSKNCNTELCPWLDGFRCFTDYEQCCGALAGNPHCIPKSSGKTCCDNTAALVTCEEGQQCCKNFVEPKFVQKAMCCSGTQSCCVSADTSQVACCATAAACCTSSFQAQCCGEGATCCKADNNYWAEAKCCSAGTTCCPISSGAKCCGASEVCDMQNARCAPASTAAPTVAPTQDPSTVNHLCLSFSTSSAGAVFYDIQTGPSGTTLKRFRNGQIIDTNWYAQLFMPAPGTITWDAGVAYAATMQTRNAWINNEPTQAATWEVVNGEHVWRFSTTINGSPTQLVFRTSNCGEIPPTAPPATATPPTNNVAHRTCLTTGSPSIYYDVQTGPTGTNLQRWNSNGQLIDTNWYAQLFMPAPGTITWDAGVAYAATMQTRNAWINNEPTQAATWEVVNGEDVWRFSTTINGSPTQLVFRTSNCVNGV